MATTGFLNFDDGRSVVWAYDSDVGFRYVTCTDRITGEDDVLFVHALAVLNRGGWVPLTQYTRVPPEETAIGSVEGGTRFVTSDEEGRLIEDTRFERIKH